MSVTSKMALTPEIKDFFSGLYKSVKDRAKAVAPDMMSPTFPVWGLLLFVVVLIGLSIYYFKATRLFETAPNINRIAKASVQAQIAYGNANVNRKGIREYLQKIKSEGVPDSHLSLTNFYISTVNAAGLFYPVENGVASPEAARTAILAGARAFVFDIWPDLTPGAEFGPCIQFVESGSLWRRISMNSLPFASVLKALVQEAFELDMRPGYYDPLILYLRFRGKPRVDTYNLTASAIGAILEPYRLDTSFNNCRSQDSLFSTPITDLFRKVIIISNTRAETSVLNDYINIGPRDGIKFEWGANEARGLTTEGVKEQSRKIKQNLTMVAPLSEEPAAEQNNWSFKTAQDLGIQMCAMNFWNTNDALKAYMAPDMFGVQSFKMKPEPLRYVIELLPIPKMPQNPGWGSGTTAGTPTKPKEIQLP